MLKLSVFLFCLCCFKDSHCQTADKPTCDSAQLEWLNLYPVNTLLGLPTFTITDSNKIDETAILTYNFTALDKSISGTVIIYDNSSYPDQIMQQVIEDQVIGDRQFPEHTRDFALLKESRKEIKGIKVGFVKERNIRGKKAYYTGRIFFYREKRQVEILLDEPVSDNKIDRYSLVDCIAEHIQIN